MKRLLIAIWLIVGCVVFAQPVTLLYEGAVSVEKKTISRTCVVSNRVYVVNYEYAPGGGCSIPATMPAGQPHYPCKVTVFESRQVGKTFSGEVTEKGCFEDKPEDMVARALKEDK